MPLSANRLWRQTPEDIRLAACKVFWTEAKGADKQILFASLAKAKNLREVTVRKMPVDKLAAWTASTPSLADQFVEDVVKKYLLHDHRAIIINFLELLNIPHHDGMIEESFDLGTLTGEGVQKAARTLLESADHAGALLYLQYLAVEGGPWAPIEEVLPAPE